MTLTRAAGALLLAVALGGLSTVMNADQGDQATARTAAPQANASTPNSDVPPDYVIGPGDVLTVSFWRRNDVSSDVVVRPDGKISLLLLDDIEASGITPEQLRDRVVEKASKLFEDARVTIIVKEVNSRNVFITGLVAKPGPYYLRGRLTVTQLIAMAGGLREFASPNRITIMRQEHGKEVGYRFNYEEVRNLKRLEQNIELKPGDTVIVP